MYRRTTLTETEARKMTDQLLDDAMWETVRPWEEQWESLKVNESKHVSGKTSCEYVLACMSEFLVETLS